MNGKDLFEAMSFIDERFIDEAEYGTLPRRLVSRWLRIAACLCLVMLSLWCVRPLWNAPPGPGPETTVPYDMPEGWPEVILYVQEMTDDGFTGTVAELVMPDPFELGMELDVVIPEDAQIEGEIRPGSYALVVCDEYDPDTGVVIARFISPMTPQ